MKTSDFEYTLPEELIAQEPIGVRDTSRLLCLSRKDGVVEHKIFRDLIEFLKPGDRLVFNNTKVFPARLYCKKDTGAKIELLFTHEINSYTWKALAKPAKRLKPGMVIFPEADNHTMLSVDAAGGVGERIISLKNQSSILEMLEKHGEVPLPPYIKRHADDDDRKNYQTVYAENRGAIAAPTAGLHFTESLMNLLTEKNIDLSFVTLHVGIGTFRPVKEDDPRKHDIHKEEYYIDSKTAKEITLTKRNGGRIIAVGTTSVRVLEHCASSDGSIEEHSGSTELMILPGYTFRIVDGLITNFHLPRSTLLMLVSAFAGKNSVLNAYREAVLKRYRFFSYGDAMLLL